MVERDVMLVEDNPDDVAVARRAFRRHDFEDHLVVATEGVAALKYLFEGGSSLPKVILLDLRMPVMDGRELLQRLRASERTRHIPIVIVSTSSHPEDVRACYQLGANSFVVKQYSKSQPGNYMFEIARYWLDLNRVT